MGRNHIAGDLTLETAGETLDIQADLTSSYLDLRDFIRRPEEREKQGRQAPADRSAPRLFSDRPLEVGFLDHSQGGIQLEVEKLVLPFLAMADAKIALELKNGRLRLDPMQARTDGGGALSGQLQLTDDKKSLTVEAILRVEHLNLETTLDRLGAEKAVTGDVGLELDLNGRGKSIRELMGGLDGKIVMVVQNGQIAAQYLKNAERLNLDLTDNFLKLFEFARKKAFAEINCFVGKFVVKEGLADCRVLVFDPDSKIIFSRLRTLPRPGRSLPKGRIDEVRPASKWMNLHALKCLPGTTGPLSSLYGKHPIVNSGWKGKGQTVNSNLRLCVKERTPCSIGRSCFLSYRYWRRCSDLPAFQPQQPGSPKFSSLFSLCCLSCR